MTKAIKFNLMLDKHPVRDLDDLLENFNLDDLLTVYNSQLLHRWLEVRGLMDELNQIIAVSSYDGKEIAQTLCKVFQVDLSNEEVKAAVYPFELRHQQKQQIEELAIQQFNRNEVIKKYHADYKDLREKMLLKNMPAKEAKNTNDGILDKVVSALSDFATDVCIANIEKHNEKASDYQFLKATISVLWQDYSQLFKVDFDSFFQLFIKNNPLTLFSMLANEEYRESGLFDDERKAIVFSKIPASPSLPPNQVFPSPYLSYAGLTDGYWKDLQPKGIKCLVLRMEASNFIRNAEKNGEELNANAVNGQFLILDGIDYKSNNANHALIYMVI